MAAALPLLSWGRHLGLATPAAQAPAPARARRPPWGPLVGLVGSEARQSGLDALARTPTPSRTARRPPFCPVVRQRLSRPPLLHDRRGGRLGRGVGGVGWCAAGAACRAWEKSLASGSSEVFVPLPCAMAACRSATPRHLRGGRHPLLLSIMLDVRIPLVPCFCSMTLNGSALVLPHDATRYKLQAHAPALSDGFPRCNKGQLLSRHQERRAQ